MVSFWPWKGDDTSTANFEKTLQTLTDKISKVNTQGALLRNRSRRLKAIWTLYTSIVYILYSLISIMVTGRNQWSFLEYTALAAGPILIYVVRTLLSIYYEYRLASNQGYLNNLHKHRNAAIEKFKNATKYNSTLQLLEKYGAEGNMNKENTSTGPAKSQPKTKDRRSSAAKVDSARTNLPPPATANIARPADPQLDIANRQASPAQSPNPSAQVSSVAQESVGMAHFADSAPNMMLAPAQLVGTAVSNHWYDRFIDLLLGEDETTPSRRLVLICTHCRLVNGQAPPGVKELEDLGRWRCFSCHGWNGEESEIKKILDQSTKQSAPSPRSVPATASSPESDRGQTASTSGP